MNIKCMIFQYLLLSTTLCNANQLYDAINDEKVAEIEKILASKKINVNEQNEYGETVLHLLMGGKQDYIIAKMLINAGADVNLQNEDGNTPLHELILYEWTMDDEDEPELKNIYINIIKLYIESGANLNLCNNVDETPLLRALIYRSPIAAKLLLTFATKFNIDAKDDGKVRALDIAAMDNNIEIAEFLIKAGADINHCDNFDHATALHFAVLENSFDVAQLLIKSGANTTIKDISGCVAYNYCQTKKMQSLFLK